MVKTGVVELQSRACLAADFLTTIMHARRYHVPAITHASSCYKSQRRDRAIGEGGDDREQKRQKTEKGEERKKKETHGKRERRKKNRGENSVGNLGNTKEGCMRI